MSEKDVKIAVEAFAMKYGGPPAQRVKWPQREFRIKGVPNAELDEKSFKKIQKEGKELWTFKGVFDIQETDGTTKVLTTRKYDIAGNTVVAFIANGGNQNELLPEVEDVTITKLEKI